MLVVQNILLTKMICKEHIGQGKQILVICDEEIHKKKIQDNDLVLDLTSSFYDGEFIKEEIIKLKLSKFYIIHAVGVKSVNFLLLNKLTNEKEIKKINNVPYVHIVLSS